MTSFSIDQFSTAPSCRYKQLFFGDKILDLESDFFWKSGCVPVLRSLSKILHASLVQINTEMADKYSNQRYAVNWHGRYVEFAQNRDFCLPHLYSTSPLGGFPSKYRQADWREKTRMAWLPDGEKISKIFLFVLAQLTNVTDRRTDRRTPHAGNSRAYA